MLNRAHLATRRIGLAWLYLLTAYVRAGKLLGTVVFDDLAAFTESLLRGNLEDAIAASRG